MKHIGPSFHPPAIITLMLAILFTGAAMADDRPSDFTDQKTILLENRDALSETERLHKLFEAVWQWSMDQYPEWATRVGHPGGDHRWTDQSREAVDRRHRDIKAQLGVLESIDREALESGDRLNHDLFHHSLTDNIDGHRFHGELKPINQMGGVQQNIAGLLVDMPTGTTEQCENILARLRGVPALIDQTIALMEDGLKRGITPPHLTMRDVPQQVKNQIVADPADAPVLKVFEELGDLIEPADRDRIRQEASSIYLDSIVPAFEKLHTYLVDTYIPGCRESIACSDLPDGREWYAYLIRHYTTTELSPDEIFQLGHAEVKRIRAEMDSLIESTGFEGDFAAFCEFLRTDPQFYFEQEDDLLREYRDIAKRIDPGLVALFGHLPRLPYGVIKVPDYAAKSQTTAYYNSGSLEAGRPGYFYANTYNLSSRPKWEMEALTVHEAVPGHHLQIAIAQELDELPMFRQHGWFTAYGEGWALYSESLGDELGLYEDPYSKFGQLTYDMWRAVRLVVDVGIHVKDWTREQAIDFFAANSSKSRHDIAVEIDRYIVWPGQALAYKIGQLKIFELRRRAEKALGERFDIRAFHDEILGQGAMPLDILEARIDRWIDSQE